MTLLIRPRKKQIYSWIGGNFNRKKSELGSAIFTKKSLPLWVTLYCSKTRFGFQRRKKNQNIGLNKHKHPFKFDQKKVLQIILCYLYFPKKIPKHCKNTMHDNFIKKNFFLKLCLTYPAVY